MVATKEIDHLLIIESIVESSPAMVFRWRVQAGWPVDYVSKNVDQLGYSQDEFLSGQVSWPGITHPDDLRRVEREVTDHLAKGTARWSQTYRILDRDGRYHWMRDWNLVYYDELGRPQEIIGMVIDSQFSS